VTAVLAVAAAVVAAVIAATRHRHDDDRARWHTRNPH